MNPQQNGNNNERSTPNPNDSQGAIPSYHRMTNQNPEPLDEEDMKYTLPKSLYLLDLEDACTRKAFESIPPNKIHLLYKALSKSKAQNQLGVVIFGEKDKKNAQ